ncbi:hypothetical protein DFH08DRAFT_820684 [Mycena albidolilacea]|uniref:Uncharacterized protein n=1 Tax=Mycena albidolilacea TaxID=1033008 RepID=A0AAD6ZCK2_9AGAR|nr:hypothetical protein DFH08DRAFT_820684 [Mycena albidolilacea]
MPPKALNSSEVSDDSDVAKQESEMVDEPRELEARYMTDPSLHFLLSLRRSKSPPLIAESNKQPDPVPDANRLTPDTVWKCSECKLPVKVASPGNTITMSTRDQ